MNNTIHIAFCTDQNYIMPTGVTMVSICENNKAEQICFHIVLTEGETSVELQEIAVKYDKQILFHTLSHDKLPDANFAGLEGITISTFARWFIPSLLPSDIEKIIYLDSDIIVLGNLRELWHYELGTSPVAAVPDIDSLEPNHRKALNIPYNIPYVNAGVQLMNLRIWREELLCEKLCECAMQKKFRYMDQDALNWYLRDRIALLPIRYNTQVSMYSQPRLYMEYQFIEEWHDCKDHPTIVHFAESDAKPWKYAGGKFCEEWHKYLNHTCWKDQVKPAVSVHGKWKQDFYSLIDSGYNSSPNNLILSFPAYFSFFASVSRLRKGGKVLSLMNRLFHLLTRIFDKIYARKLKKLDK